jgi:hypothetical protein
MTSCTGESADVLRLGHRGDPMATAHAHFPATLAEALEKLRRDPAHPVRAQVENLQVELRAVTIRKEDATSGLGDLMAAAGPWEGESTEELLRILRESRDAGGSAEPPEGL